MPRAGPKKVRNHSLEFKLKAVKLSQLKGVEVQAVADALEDSPIHAVAVAQGSQGWRAPRPQPTTPLAANQRADRVAQPGAIIPPVVELPQTTRRHTAAVGCGDAPRSTPRVVKADEPHVPPCFRRGWSAAMNPWIAKAVILAASVVMVAIRAPHGQRSRGVTVVTDRKGRLEVILLVLAMLGFFCASSLDRLPVVLACGVPAAHGSTLGRGCVLRGRPLALLPVTRGSRDKLVHHAPGAGEPPTRRGRRLPTHPTSNVRSALPLFDRAGARVAKLGGGSVLLGHLRDPLRASRSCGGELDA